MAALQRQHASVLSVTRVTVRSAPDMAESEKERIDRELIELLNELRVTLPGVQVLFAFLLVVPFSNGWQKVTELQKDVYFAALVSAALASACLIAPAANHRIQFRQGTKVKEALLFRANKLAIAGTVFLAAGISCSIFLITDVLFEATSAALLAAAFAVLNAVLWYVLPFVTRVRAGDSR
jgi:hypothetical protein